MDVTATAPTPDSSRTPRAVTDIALPIFIFDGDCGFCTMSVDFLKRWIRPRATILPWQFVDLSALQLTQAQCSEAVQWVRRIGEVQSGAAAVACALKSARAPWPVAGTIMAAPVIRVVADRIYKLIAKNRYRLPGSTPACKVTSSVSGA